MLRAGQSLPPKGLSTLRFDAYTLREAFRAIFAGDLTIEERRRAARPVFPNHEGRRCKQTYRRHIGVRI